ncbi:MAG: carboxypeptidase regulatory-like domain-containing protein [Candidatus Solibacter usitatus]|nr:carboxypeptidase regulatory-like domain-containing protein [Candidatus Solibacter usitatus]
MFCRFTAIAFAISVSLVAQDYRGQIAGRILDPSGAGIPGATVIITSVATNAPARTKSDEAGRYTALYLSPGNYKLTVEAAGFKKLLRQGIEVRVADQLTLDLPLEVGNATETVNVTAEAELLETSSASTGQVIDQKRIQDLPLSDGNPFVLHRLAPGVIYTGDLKFSRPFDNAGTAAITVDGAPGGNEFTLDGSPNMASGRRVAYVPPRDTVEEFKVETASFDAQDGHTAGGTVNVALKSGSNAPHGTLYEFLRNDKLSGNDFFLNRSGRPRDTLRYNLYGGTVGGPVMIPKIYNGKNKTFFFFGFEGIKDRFPEPTLNTVPTPAQRNGDLSALLALGASFQIYDPLTATTAAGGRVQRAPLSGNVIPQSRINAISKNYLNFYPLPNQAGDVQGRNNFLSGNVRGDDFHSETYRFDHNLTSSQKIFARITHNSRRESRGNWSGVTNNVRATGNFLFRINDGATLDHVWTISPSTILNWRVGFSRFDEPNIRPHEGAFDPAMLGFAQRTVALFGGFQYVPRFNIGGYTAIGDGIGGGSTHNIYSLQPTLTRIAGGGRHQLRIGYDGRSYRENAYGPGNAAGSYDFGTNYTRGPLDNTPSAPIGQEFASFLLGQVTGGSIDRNASRANQVMYHSVFVHDDYKLTNRITLNLGLRYEYEGGMTERYNRNTRGFDLTTASPIEAAAKAAYAANPIPQLAASAFQVKGGYLFASPSARGVWTGDKNNFQPRIGIAYKIAKGTVLRGGWGVYMIPLIISGVNQAGFSQATNIVPTADAGLTFQANLSNPFPNGVLDPPGASRGLLTFIGRGLSNVPVEARNGMSQRFELGVQHEMRGRILVQAGFVTNRGYNLTTSTNRPNAVPKQYLSTSAERDQTTIDFLSANVTNPFRDLIPGEGLNGTVTSRGQLLRAFPHLTGLGQAQYDGSTSYYSFQSKVEKRFSRGYTLLTSYTLSRLREKVSYLNDVDTDYEERLAVADRRQRIVFSGIWDLPFGRGRAIGANWSRLTNALIGGWQTSGIAQFQTGGPLNFDSNYLFRGDRNSVALGAQDNIDRWFNTSGFETATARQLGSNFRTAARQFPGVSGQGLNLWDLSVIKAFQITETMKVQFRTEFLNAFNHPQFNDPDRTPTNSNFGRSTGQGNLPRNIQFALKLLF